VHLISFLLKQPTILFGQTDHGSGGEGMRGKDEMTRIQAFGSPRSAEMPRAAKRHRKNRGMPPPATLNIDTLPGSSIYRH
jgi:hypothetical protein